QRNGSVGAPLILPYSIALRQPTHGLPGMPRRVSLRPHMSEPNSPIERPHRRALRLQESGLLIVIVLLGAVLTFRGGTVKVPLFETNAQGERQRAFKLNQTGEREPVLLERNKFL